MEKQAMTTAEEVEEKYMYGIYQIKTIEDHIPKEPLEWHRKNVFVEIVQAVEGFNDLEAAKEALKKYISKFRKITPYKGNPRFETEVYVLADVDEEYDRFEDSCYGDDIHACADFDSELLRRLEENDSDDDYMDEDIY